MRFIGQGSFGTAYLMPDGRVAKFSSRGLSFIRGRELNTSGIELDHEFHVAQALYMGGVNVPKHYGVQEIEVPSLRISHTGEFRNPCSRPVKARALVMDFIEGQSLSDVPFQHAGDVSELLRDQLAKARALGLVPGHDVASSGNEIWVPEKGKVYLIDFGVWGSKRPLEFNPNIRPQPSSASLLIPSPSR